MYFYYIIIIFFIILVAPGPPRDLSIKVTSRFDAISLTLYYYGPADNGGTINLKGNITTCIVNTSSNALESCIQNVTVLGSSSKGYFLYDNLKQKTKYYFSINFQSDVNQVGPSTTIYYTTPSLGKWWCQYTILRQGSRNKRQGQHSDVEKC